MRAPIPLYALALAVAAPIPVVGAAAFGLAAAVLAIGFASGQASTGRGWSAAGPGAAQLGGAVGALEALARVGTTDPYRDRVGLGVAALVLAFVAGAAIVAIRRPATGAALTVLAGVVGAGAMAAFYLETYYFAALPLWLVGAALALGGGTPTPKAGGGG